MKGSIKEARTQMITGLLAMCQTLVERYRSEGIVCERRDKQPYGKSSYSKSDLDAGETAFHCDSFSLGSLLIALRHAQVVPDPLVAKDVHKSVSDLKKKLRRLKCPSFGGDGSPHELCRFSIKIRREIENIESSGLNIGVDAAQLKHMQDQALR